MNGRRYPSGTNIPSNGEAPVAIDSQGRILTSPEGGTTGASPVYTDDTNLAQGTKTNNATVGIWTELLSANAARLGAAVQNRSGADVYIVQAAAAPANGAQNGEIHLPPDPAYFKFDWNPKKRYFMRATAASAAVTVMDW